MFRCLSPRFSFSFMQLFSFVPSNQNGRHIWVSFELYKATSTKVSGNKLNSLSFLKNVNSFAPWRQFVMSTRCASNITSVYWGGEESSSSRSKSSKLIVMLCFRLAFWSEFVYRVTSCCRNASPRQNLLWTDLSKCFIFTSPYKRSSKFVMWEYCMHWRIRGGEGCTYIVANYSYAPYLMFLCN